MEVMPSVQITESEWQIVQCLLQTHAPGLKVWAYGSRVKHKARRTSDLDLAVFADPSQSGVISRLREEFEDSRLPFPVDVHVWDLIADRFQREIQIKYVEIQAAGQISN